MNLYLCVEAECVEQFRPFIDKATWIAHLATHVSESMSSQTCPFCKTSVATNSISDSPWLRAKTRLGKKTYSKVSSELIRHLSAHLEHIALMSDHIMRDVLREYYRLEVLLGRHEFQDSSSAILNTTSTFPLPLNERKRAMPSFEQTFKDTVWPELLMDPRSSPTSWTSFREFKRPNDPKVWHPERYENPKGSGEQHAPEHRLLDKRDYLFKRVICIDPNEAGIKPRIQPFTPLYECEACANKESYLTYYDAAKHLQSAHFHPIQPTREDMDLWHTEVFVFPKHYDIRTEARTGVVSQRGEGERDE